MLKRRYKSCISGTRFTLCNGRQHFDLMDPNGDQIANFFLTTATFKTKKRRLCICQPLKLVDKYIFTYI